MRPTVGSLFSGVGGFDCAFEREGFRVAWQVEIDPHAQSVLRRHFPDAPLYSDVREVGAHNLASVDVITFGSPCQDLSVAGKRAGLVGERSGLFHEAIRIIRELRPSLAVWENVPGVLSSAKGADFGAILDALAECGALDICYRILDAQWFGVAQRRRRLFLVADFRGERAEEILFESDRLRGDTAPCRAAGQEIADPLGTVASASGGHRLDLDTAGAYVPALASTQSAGESRYNPGTPRADGSDTLIVPATLNGYDEEQPHGRHVVPTISSKWHKGSGGPAGDEAQNLVAVAAFDPANVTSKANRTRVAFGAPANTIHTQGFAVITAFDWQTSGSARTRPIVSERYTPSLQANKTPAVHTVAAVRRLTPTECERLQGFDDGWTAEQADSHRYRQLGNAVAVPVAAWLARRIMEVTR